MKTQTIDRALLEHLAKLGAPQRLEELRREMTALEQLLDSADDSGSRNGRSMAKKPSGPAQTAPVNTPRKKPGKRGRTMSAAARKAISTRMKAYWASQRA